MSLTDCANTAVRNGEFFLLVQLLLTPLTSKYFSRAASEHGSYKNIALPISCLLNSEPHNLWRFLTVSNRSKIIITQIHLESICILFRPKRYDIKECATHGVYRVRPQLPVLAKTKADIAKKSKCVYCTKHTLSTKLCDEFLSLSLFRWRSLTLLKI